MSSRWDVYCPNEGVLHANFATQRFCPHCGAQNPDNPAPDGPVPNAPRPFNQHRRAITPGGLINNVNRPDQTNVAVSAASTAPVQAGMMSFTAANNAGQAQAQRRAQVAILAKRAQQQSNASSSAIGHRPVSTPAIPRPVRDVSEVIDIHFDTQKLKTNRSGSTWSPTTKFHYSRIIVTPAQYSLAGTTFLDWICDRAARSGAQIFRKLETLPHYLDHFLVARWDENGVPELLQIPNEDVPTLDTVIRVFSKGIPRGDPPKVEIVIVIATTPNTRREWKEEQETFYERQIRDPVILEDNPPIENDTTFLDDTQAVDNNPILSEETLGDDEPQIPGGIRSLGLPAAPPLPIRQSASPSEERNRPEPGPSTPYRRRLRIEPEELHPEPGIKQEKQSSTRKFRYPRGLDGQSIVIDLTDDTPSPRRDDALRTALASGEDLPSPSAFLRGRASSHAERAITDDTSPEDIQPEAVKQEDMTPEAVKQEDSNQELGPGIEPAPVINTERRKRPRSLQVIPPLTMKLRRQKIDDNAEGSSKGKGKGKAKEMPRDSSNGGRRGGRE